MMAAGGVDSARKRAWPHLGSPREDRRKRFSEEGTSIKCGHHGKLRNELAAVGDAKNSAAPVVAAEEKQAVTQKELRTQRLNDSITTSISAVQLRGHLAHFNTRPTEHLGHWILALKKFNAGRLVVNAQQHVYHAAQWQSEDKKGRLDTLNRPRKTYILGDPFHRRIRTASGKGQ
ncbi:hypothetical protein MRX96_015208 [Rhipicephalus microplus]